MNLRMAALLLAATSTDQDLYFFACYKREKLAQEMTL